LSFPVVIPFLDHLGMRLVEHGNDQAVVELALEPWMLNSFGVGHGGVVMTLLDVAMALSGRSASDDLARGNVTIEMKSTFLAPAQGTHLRAVGRCLKRTGRLAFCEADIVDSGGQLVAKSSGTFRRMLQAQEAK
jgi:uncharacterized protein (TIGR00369 family)